LANPSSTSSSEPDGLSPSGGGTRRALGPLPWAAILAAGAFLLLDQLALGQGASWPWISRQVRGFGSLYAGVASDQAQLQQARRQAADRPAIFVVGTSRARRGFRNDVARSALPETFILRFAHPKLDPLVTRSMAPDLIDAGADAVVLYLSEFDTHRPLRIDPIPAKGTDSPVALLEVFSDAGWRFAWRERELLYRITLSSLLKAYRFRDLIAQTRLGELRVFPLGDRLVKPARQDMRGRASLGQPVVRVADPAIRALFSGALPEHMAEDQRSLLWMREIRLGDHARVSMEIVRRAVDRFVAADVQVLIVEAPIQRAGMLVREAGTREEFVEMALRLAEHSSVRFLALEDQPPIAPGGFLDVMHLRPEASARLTERVVVELRAMLESPQAPARQP
jgi:hypothetical protein